MLVAAALLLSVAGTGCDDGMDAVPDGSADSAAPGSDAAPSDSSIVPPVGTDASPDADAGEAGAPDGGSADGGLSDGGADDAGMDAGVSCPPSNAATIFVDCAGDRGVDFESSLRPPFLVAGGVAMLDGDNDGDLDLFFTGEAVESRYYLNDGTGHFTDATILSGLGGIDWARGVTAADYDDDGDVDLYVGRVGANQLYKNLGNGTFTEVAVAAGVDNPEMTLGGAWGDYDGDGDLDLYTANYLENAYSRGYPTFDGPPNNLYRNNGDGTFTDVAPAMGVDSIGATLGVAFTDFDNDGDVDLVEVNDYGMGAAEHNTIYRNDGPGGPAGWLFADVGVTVGFAAGIFGMSAIPGDYDNDGWIDIYASDICRNVLHHNLGGTFEEVSSSAGIPGYGYPDPSEPFTGWPMPNPTGDVFQAGMVDYLLLYTDFVSTDLCTTSWSGGFYDFDHDGWQDFYIANGYVKAAPFLPEGRFQPNFTYLNNGDGTFVDVTAASGGDTTLESRGVAFGDLDGDGDIDIAVHNSGMTAPPAQRPSLLFNVFASGAWLKVKLRGVNTNRDGIGARVEIWSGGAYQMREVAAGTGSFSRSDTTVHFGLAGALLVDTLTVTWPNGVIDTFTNLAVDQDVLIIEGTGP